MSFITQYKLLQLVYASSGGVRVTGGTEVVESLTGPLPTGTVEPVAGRQLYYFRMKTVIEI